MKTFDLTTRYETYKNCYFIINTYYADESLALEIWNNEEGPIAGLTTCLGSATKGYAYLDINNCPWAIDLVNKLGIGADTGKIERSGFCFYPLYEFNMEKVKEYGTTEEDRYDF